MRKATRSFWSCCEVDLIVTRIEKNNLCPATRDGSLVKPAYEDGFDGRGFTLPAEWPSDSTNTLMSDVIRSSGSKSSTQVCSRVKLTPESS